MKFRYYITNTLEGCINGTNNEVKAEELAECEDHFVIDAKTGEWLIGHGERIQVEKNGS